MTVPALAEPGEFLLVHRGGQVQPIRLVEITDQKLQYMRDDQGWPTVDLTECVALLNPNVTNRARPRGLLTLADGQRFPGEAIANAKPREDALAWSHPWLGRMDVPMKLIESIAFTPNAVPPSAATADADVILLGNGDRREGFITALGNPISIEIEQEGAPPQVMEIPLHLVAAITMVTPRQQPVGRRIWFSEGTVLDVASLTVGVDGYVRLGATVLASGTPPTRIGVADIAAVLFDPTAMLALASLNPSRVEGPDTRYVLLKPLALDPDAPLGVSRLEYRGPLIVRYALPAGWNRFYAEAELPEASRAWGDYELIVRSNDAEVFRAHLNAQSPGAVINVELPGRELTIELLPGAYGPIQDQLILHRAMLLK